MAGRRDREIDVASVHRLNQLMLEPSRRLVVGHPQDISALLANIGMDKGNV